MTVAEKPRSIDNVRVAAFCAAVSSLCGVAISVALTVVKFTADHGCDSTLIEGCGRIGPGLGAWLASHASCTVTFTSRWASLLGVPVTIYAASFYLLALLLAGGLALGRDPWAPHGRRLLLGLALVQVTGSMGMLAISVLVLGTFCLFCSGLYVISLLLLACALVCARGEVRSLFSAPVMTALRPASLRIVVGAVALTLTQSAVYSLLPSVLRANCACLSRGTCSGTELPDTRLVFGDHEHPRVTIAAFLDPACGHCARQFAALESLADQTALGAELRVFWAPHEDHACGFTDVVATSMGSAEQWQSCSVAQLAECAEDIRPGSGLAALAAAFTAQTGPAHERRDALIAAVRGVVAPGDAQAMAACAADLERPAARRLHGHMKYVDKDNLDLSPSMLVIPRAADGAYLWKYAERYDGVHNAAKLAKVCQRLLAHVE